MYKNIPTPRISQTAVLQLNMNPTSVDHRNVSTMAYHGVFTVYDILAFSIRHVWCLKINAYHIEYLRDERNNLLKEAWSKLEYVKAYSLQIGKSKYGDFVPGIRMTGLRVPLDNTGYTLGIFLTIFTLAEVLSASVHNTNHHANFLSIVKSIFLF